VTAAAQPDWLLLERDQADLIDYDGLTSIYNKGKLALLASWRNRPAAEQFKPPFRAGVAGSRHRLWSATKGCSIEAKAPDTTAQSSAGQRRRRKRSRQDLRQGYPVRI
jgi:hypothetical protein